MTDTHYLIIGNGVAGISAVQAIRELDDSGAIAIVSDEKRPYYYRAALSEWVSGRSTPGQLSGRQPFFYDTLRAEQLYGIVDRVDTESRSAFFSNGESLRYQELLIATGARANRISIPGLDESYVLRSYADAMRLRERAGDPGRVIILGGGVLGLEIAGALYHAGVSDITIVHLMQYLGGPLLNEQSAAWLHEKIAADGLEVFLEDTVVEVKDKVAYLKNGGAIPFDLFVQAVGITPTFPEIPGLEIGKGIRVDRGCATNIPHVHAAGDCTELRDNADGKWKSSRFWLDGARQGRVAGQNMCGADARLAHEPFYNASYIYTFPYSYIGAPHSTAGPAHVRKDGNGYRLVRVLNGKVTGALLIGERHGALAILDAMGQDIGGVTVDPSNPDFPWNDLADNNWDYRFY